MIHEVYSKFVLYLKYAFFTLDVVYTILPLNK